METLDKMLKRHEGTGPIKNGRFMLYKCPANKWTVGYGRNLEDRGLSRREAEYLLQNDIAEAYSSAEGSFQWFSSLSRVRQMVIVDMIYNLGLAGLKEFKRTLASIERGDYATAADEMMESKWARQVGFRANELAYMMREDRAWGA